MLRDIFFYVCIYNDFMNSFIEYIQNFKVSKVPKLEFLKYIYR